jgi:hypothetical protein
MYQVYSNTNTSPCASSPSHRTKRRLGCASHPCLTSSPVSSCFSAGSAQTMWEFGRQRLLAQLLRMARRSGRTSLALIRCSRRITLCSECWNGEGWKLNEYESQVGGSDLFLVLVLFLSLSFEFTRFTCSSIIRKIVHLQ